MVAATLPALGAAPLAAVALGSVVGLGGRHPAAPRLLVAVGGAAIVWVVAGVGPVLDGVLPPGWWAPVAVAALLGAGLALRAGTDSGVPSWVALAGGAALLAATPAAGAVELADVLAVVAGLVAGAVPILVLEAADAYRGRHGQERS